MNVKKILAELKRHMPFTTIGALTGTLLMVLMIFVGLSQEASHTIFHVLHSPHILFSAIMTTALYRKYRGNVWAAVLIGLSGAPKTGFLYYLSRSSFCLWPSGSRAVPVI
ncbi:MAG: hypothetical protein ACLFTQ_00145 [Candidatus Aenigmatarchaeota archaeon]